MYVLYTFLAIAFTRNNQLTSVKKKLRFVIKQTDKSNDPLHDGVNWCVKGTQESTLGKDTSVSLMNHDPSVLGLICLVKKRKIRSWI